MKRLASIVFACCALSCGANELTYWAKQAQNPLADLIKLPIETKLDFGYGPKNGVSCTSAFQPSMVSALSDDWNLVNRLDIPFKYQPGRTVGEKDSFGLSDVTYESFYTLSGRRRFNIGLGPAFQIPTATDPQIGTGKWSAGLSVAAHLETGAFTAGIRANQLWSFAGKDHREDVNRTLIEYWIYANLGRGWWIGTSPVNIANWEADSKNIRTVPVGGGFGKVIDGRLPLNLKLEAYTYPESPNDLADWSMFFSIEYLLPENALFKR
ncbi:hypothetical protein EGM51_00780 [Verrucomicrobia bacterium S94]|nr:hypothetical protein EGM51_00780 [Verrucomicrobia bacterium S94]